MKEIRWEVVRRQRKHPLYGYEEGEDIETNDFYYRRVDNEQSKQSRENGRLQKRGRR